MTGPKKILVVDDDPLLRELLYDTLTSIGYEAVAASDAVSALKHLASEPIKLVISDIRMPEVDGLELLEIIRSKYPRLPVLFITAFLTPEIIASAKPDGYLLKPFRISQIEELIKNTLENAGHPSARQG